MKIFRNGEAFELTFGEIIQAHEEYELACAIEYIDSILGSGTKDVELSDQQINEVARLALRNLNKNDCYFESYYTSVEQTLDDYINSLLINKEEDDE